MSIDIYVPKNAELSLKDIIEKNFIEKNFDKKIHLMS